MCGEVITTLEQEPEYRKHLKDRIVRPADDLEKQMNMTSEEQEAKEALILDLFKEGERIMAEQQRAD